MALVAVASLASDTPAGSPASAADNLAADNLAVGSPVAWGNPAGSPASAAGSPGAWGNPAGSPASVVGNLAAGSPVAWGNPAGSPASVVGSLAAWDSLEDNLAFAADSPVGGRTLAATAAWHQDVGAVKDCRAARGSWLDFLDERISYASHDGQLTVFLGSEI